MYICPCIAYNKNIQQYQEKRASLNADIDRILAQITEILGIDITAEEEKG